MCRKIIKRDLFVHLKKFIPVIMVLFAAIACNNEDDKNIPPENHGDYVPLKIGYIKFTDAYNEGKKHSQKAASYIYTDKKISSDSSIRFSGYSAWYGNKESISKHVSGNTLRSSEYNLKSKGIGIFRLSNGIYSEEQKNIHYTYNSDENSWVPSDAGNPVRLTKSEVPLCSYYPYSSNLSNGNATLTSQLYSDNEDFCYQTGKTASSDSIVSFTLQHAYSKITFKFKREDSYSGKGNVSKISISGNEILSSNTFNIKTGSYGAGTLGPVTVNPGIYSISSGETKSSEILLVPVASLNSNVTFEFTIDGKKKTGIFSPSINTFTAFKAGKNYTINISMTKSLVIVTGETANCYIVSPENGIRFPVNIKGNGKADAVAGTGLNISQTAASMGILWETSANLITISNFNSSEQTVTVVTNDLSNTGNAVIAAYAGPDCTGNILWSWHIWITDYNPNETPVKNGNIYTIANTNGSYTWMDRNLGATTTTPATITTMGLLYQWGRKDPFPGADIVYYYDPDTLNQKENYDSPYRYGYYSTAIYDKTGNELIEGNETDGSGTGITHAYSVDNTENNILNLHNSILNPMTFYINNDWYTINGISYQNDLLWGGTDSITPTGKTIFDPCPPGWRVPAWNGSSPWSNFSSDNYIYSDTYYGCTYNEETFYPAAGCRRAGMVAFDYIGTACLCWSATVSSAETANSFVFQYFGLDTEHANYRAFGFSVRCVKE